MTNQYRKRFSNSNLQECISFKNSIFLRKRYEKICELIDKIFILDQDSLICEGYIEEAGKLWWFWLNFTKQKFHHIFQFLIKEKVIKTKFTRREFIKNINKRKNTLEITNQIAESRAVVKLVINISIDPKSPECTHFIYNRLTEVYGFGENQIIKAFKFFNVLFMDV